MGVFQTGVPLENRRALDDPSHLYCNRHGTFYFRLCIPRDLRGYVGATEVRLSMDTEQRRAAIMHAFPLVLDLPNLWAGLRVISANDELIPPDYFKLWRQQLLENARLKMSVVQLKEQLEQQPVRIWRMVPKNQACLVVKQAYTKRRTLYRHQRHRSIGHWDVACGAKVTGDSR